MNWIDSHCHLNDSWFDDDLKEVLGRMKEAEVSKALIVSCNVPDYEKALRIKEEGLSFKYSLGIYPGDVEDLSEEDISLFEEREKDEKCVAVGEIGLDYHYGSDTKERQKEIFERQLIHALRIDKPVIVHSREAIQDTYDLMKKHRCRGVMHCYSDSAEMAEEFVKLGYYISISGTVTFKNARHPLEVIKRVPLDRLLIETDSPYLTPVPYRGRRNEPSYVVLTGKRIAEELGLDIEEFKRQLDRNYESLFKI